MKLDKEGKGVAAEVKPDKSGDLKRTKDSIFLVEVDKISHNPYQPRQSMDRGQLLELAMSIKEYGILQPLVVTKVRKENDRGQEIQYELVAGHRRLEAAKIAGLPHVPVVVRETTDQQKLELALIENIQRSDLNPIEKATAFKRLHEEFGMGHARIGEKIGRSRESVTNTIRLLKLPEEVQKAIREGKISEGHARGLQAIKDEKELLRVFRDALNRGLNVREIEEEAKSIEVKNHTRRGAFFSEVKEYRENLAGFLGAPVNITKRGLGGRLIIPFKDKPDLEGIIKRIME